MLRRALIVLLALALVALAWLEPADGSAEAQTQRMLSRALVTFALARSLNGVISVIQETEVAVQPGGLGVQLAPGQILDPVNDLIEQFSWIMLASAASLGIQRLLLEVSQWPGMSLFLTAAVLGWIALVFYRKRPDWRQLAARTLLLALFLRFAVPCVSLVSDTVYRLFLDPVYVSASESLDRTQASLTQLHDEAAAEAESEDSSGWSAWWGRATDQFRVRERIEAYQALFAELAEDIVQLVAVFVLQTILLPLLFLWVLIRLWRQLWRVSGGG
ncbi:hypothetical protein [Wenzhouxiangella marina]|uniref:hypothetical protein n=1 Tax=Wenzhouxiangella marina TaxID=1579979 RepID=UPI00067360EF|nr:hypothetical protein [Wenzhouxiangella marina]MBB6086765.1 hypothetical protein [Wenzhouxiangella marina]